ncbi:thrombomodulin-like [Notolabrus celidotus]|uniref:thrombomodulin-like n=1 Tax=Notolabrus celidotus TaxID=1203425 RepID=UPI00148F8416|nr:thrombomodulin-like [Notolabrus celidotus]
MVPPTRALTICVIFLFRLEKTAFSQHGYCAQNKCFAYFLEPRDSSGAQKSCKDKDGQLLMYSSANKTILSSLVGGLSGRYWLEVSSSSEKVEEAPFQKCSSIFVSMGRDLEVQWEPCRETLDGFLCEYAFSEHCGGLRTGGGVQITYGSHTGFEVKDSETFPEGTIAVAKKVGGKFLDSRHVCFSGGWMQAPWGCEVMKGGCDYTCDSTTHTCVCPAGQSLLSNNISCPTDPCADCAHECHKDGDTSVCKCREGYRLAPDNKTCVDVLECTEKNPCTGEHMECEEFKCRCKYDFVEEAGVCVDVSICTKCEHYCEIDSGVYQCQCKKGFRVSTEDPTKCEQDCTQRECLAYCTPNPDNMSDMWCRCPFGYVKDMINNTAYCTDINECMNERQCDHKCANTFGSFRCSCDQGFQLYKEYRCILIEQDEQDGEDGGSGFTPFIPTPASAQPAPVPSYIKTGSVLGITVFMALFGVLLYFLVRHIVKRCGHFQLSSIKHRDIDIFYLQQVTTGTYKRLSFDRQL